MLMSRGGRILGGEASGGWQVAGGECQVSGGGGA
jgi:hypothetical protein